MSMSKCLKQSRADAIRGAMPSAITLRMSADNLKKIATHRIQNRTVKSIRLGEMEINYETGMTAAGVRIAPGELNLIVAPGMTFAYDTIVFVTFLRYVHLMQREEIQAEILRNHYFKISTGSISELSLMGLAYLERCHFANSAKLSELYGDNCFILHLDGTNEGGMYNHFVVRDGIRGNTLCAEKIVSESEESIKPILKKVKKYFGVPDAVVSDMSPAIGKAVGEVFENVPHKLCHFHFLKAVGKSLLEEKNRPQMISLKRMKEMLTDNRKKLLGELEKRRNAGHREDGMLFISLIDYVNDYQKDLSGEGFPFDLPVLAFHDRCEKAFNMIENIFREAKKEIPQEFCSIMMFVRNRLQEYFSYSHINQLRNLNAIFLELRDILHPSDKTETTPLNWGMLDAGIQVEDIAEKLENFRVRAEKKTKTKLSPYLMKAWKIVLNRLRKYEGKLDPVIEFNGEKFILPRTNNLCETGFRDCKRKARRTTGLKNLSNHMDNLPAQYFYTFNLDDPEYLKAVFGNGEICDSFHEIEKDDVRRDVEKMKIQRLSPKKINHKLIRSDNYLKELAEHFIGTNSKKGDSNLQKSA